MGFTLILVGLFGLWFYINLDLVGFDVYLVKYIYKNGINISFVIIDKELLICKRNIIVDVYGDLGCFDNLRREYLCVLF